jgi:hypothetical protein
VLIYKLDIVWDYRTLYLKNWDKNSFNTMLWN